jgi:hypothetical protein
MASVLISLASRAEGTREEPKAASTPLQQFLLTRGRGERVSDCNSRIPRARRVSDLLGFAVAMTSLSMVCLLIMVNILLLFKLV